MGTSSFSDQDQNWIRIHMSLWIRIRTQEGKNDPQEKKKSTRNFMFEKLDVLFGALADYFVA
jgi:hypothetical protein